MRLTHTIVVVVAAVALADPRLGHAEAPKVGVSVTFTDAGALEAYRAYVDCLAADPSRFARELATLERLERSDVQYVVRLGGRFDGGVEGALSTDGARIFVTVSDEGGAYGEAASLNSRFAHELEHARQFDEGELAFAPNAKTGRWEPVYSSYDIGDEIKAWEAQLAVSTPKDFWLVTDRKRKPSLLQLFAAASTPERRAQVLCQHGYKDRNPVPDSDVVFPARLGFTAGQVIHAAGDRAFFGRVRRVSRASA